MQKGPFCEKWDMRESGTQKCPHCLKKCILLYIIYASQRLMILMRHFKMPVRMAGAELCTFSLISEFSGILCYPCLIQSSMLSFLPFMLCVRMVVLCGHFCLVHICVWSFMLSSWLLNNLLHMSNLIHYI